MIRSLFLLLGWALLALGAPLATAGSLRYCDEAGAFDAAGQDRLIRVAAVAKAELEASGQQVALVARSGLALQYFGHRYSHAGVSLQASNNTPWSVRQLYYACDEKRPRIFDQGMAGFLLGAHNASHGYVSIVFLPTDAASALAHTALDDQQVLQLQAATYSANAYAYGLRYQNCNQWLVELLASAWNESAQDTADRAAAQRWLQQQDYRPSVMRVGWRPLMWLADRIQWFHSDDHPQEDLDAAQFSVSMPASIEAFVRARLPQASHVELCYTEDKVVVRHGWEPLSNDCAEAPGDTVTALRAE